VQYGLKNAVVQGIGVATGMQDRFSWAGVAASVVGNSLGEAVGGLFSNEAVGAVIGGTAGILASAATRSLIDGSDFGDNVAAALPDIIANTVGAMITEGVRSKSAALSKTTSGSGSGPPVGASAGGGSDVIVSAGGYIDSSEWAEGEGISPADGLQIQSTSGRLNSDNVVIGRSLFSDEGNPFATWAAVSKSGLNFSDGLNFVTSDGGAWAQFEAGGHKVVLNDIFYSDGQWVHHGTWDGEAKIFTDNAAVPLQYIMDEKVVNPTGNNEVAPVELHADKKTWGVGVSRFMYEPVIFSEFDYRKTSDIGFYCPVGTSLQRTSFGGPVIQRVRVPDPGLLRLADDYEATNNPVAAARARLRAQDPDAADAYLKSGAAKQFYNDTISLFETAFVAGTGNPDLLNILPRIPRAQILPEERTGAKTLTSFEIAGSLFTPWSVGDVLIPGRFGMAAAGATGYRPLLLTSPESTESLFAAGSGSAKFIGQGFSPAQADYLAQPYVGMGHHFVPRRLGLPSIISDSPLNILKPNGISRGDFYELHFKVDPHYPGSRLPASVGGGVWNGNSLGLEKYGAVGRLWYGSPTPLKVTVGGAVVATGGGVYWYSSERK
jgi:hypothetical protein